MDEIVWVFNGSSGHFASAVFSSKENAEAWIAKKRLTGILTAYPLNIGIYDWAIQNGFFEPTEDKHKIPEFIQRFSSASQEHYHYEDGSR